jgi:tight adherence protein B
MGLVPYAVILGVLATLAFLLTAYWALISERVATFGNRFQMDLDAAGMQIEPEKFGMITIGAGALVWTILILSFRPDLIVGLLLSIFCAGVGAYGARAFLQVARKRRIAQFQDQFEYALRAMASGVRVGLGIRQAFERTAKQSRNPIKAEFTRVVGLSNVGVSILDGFDQMGLRMTNPETAMFARSLRVQSQTGGNLSNMLEGLANTIRDRRRLYRKIGAITAQGRATGWLLGLLPIGMGAFLIVAEPQLREAMLYTMVGQISLGLALALDGIAVFSLIKIVNIEP